MTRFLALDAARQPLGPPFESPDQGCAYAQGRLLYPGQCAAAQSVLDAEEERLNWQALARQARTLKRARDGD